MGSSIVNVEFKKVKDSCNFEEICESVQSGFKEIEKQKGELKSKLRLGSELSDIVDYIFCCALCPKEKLYCVESCIDDHNKLLENLKKRNRIFRFTKDIDHIKTEVNAAIDNISKEVAEITNLENKLKNIKRTSGSDEEKNKPIRYWGDVLAQANNIAQFIKTSRLKKWLALDDLTGYFKTSSACLNEFKCWFGFKNKDGYVSHHMIDEFCSYCNDHYTLRVNAHKILLQLRQAMKKCSDVVSAFLKMVNRLDRTFQSFNDWSIKCELGVYLSDLVKDAKNQMKEFKKKALLDPLKKTARYTKEVEFLANRLCSIGWSGDNHGTLIHAVQNIMRPELVLREIVDFLDKNTSKNDKNQEKLAIDFSNSNQVNIIKRKLSEINVEFKDVEKCLRGLDMNLLYNTIKDVAKLSDTADDGLGYIKTLYKFVSDIADSKVKTKIPQKI